MSGQCGVLYKKREGGKRRPEMLRKERADGESPALPATKYQLVSSKLPLGVTWLHHHHVQPAGLWSRPATCCHLPLQDATAWGPACRTRPPPPRDWVLLTISLVSSLQTPPPWGQARATLHSAPYCAVANCSSCHPVLLPLRADHQPLLLHSRPWEKDSSSLTYLLHGHNGACHSADT